jgi:hypothetical protein
MPVPDPVPRARSGARSGALTREEPRELFRRRSEMQAPTKKRLLPKRLGHVASGHHARFAGRFIQLSRILNNGD